MNRIFASTIIFCSCATFVAAPPAALAAPLTFTIDPTRSQVTYSVETSPGSPFTVPEFSGSDTARMSGTQTVNVTGSSVQFLSTGNIQFAVQPSPAAPAVGGAYPGNVPAQFGVLAQIPGALSGPGPGGTGLIAVRGLVGDVTSGVIPLSGGAFDASQAVGYVVAGNLRREPGDLWQPLRLHHLRDWLREQ